MTGRVRGDSDRLTQEQKTAHARRWRSRTATHHDDLSAQPGNVALPLVCQLRLDAPVGRVPVRWDGQAPVRLQVLVQQLQSRWQVAAGRERHQYDRWQKRLWQHKAGGSSMLVSRKLQSS